MASQDAHLPFILYKVEIAEPNSAPGAPRWPRVVGAYIVESCWVDKEKNCANLWRSSFYG